jgi:hypothetical protein
MFHMTGTTAPPLENGWLLSKGKLKDKGQRRRENRGHSRASELSKSVPSGDLQGVLLGVFSMGIFSND